ncbi:MAG: peptidylprolyl isomerase [Halomonadaceae bacterium]|nr:MAG: peptidylprolyl isomerase [Halomonadaceae bacterium]
MIVTEARVYTIAYRLKNREGDIIDSSDGAEPLHFVSGAGQVVPGIEKAVAGREVGACLEVTIPPELAYGEHREDMVRTMPRSMFQGVDNLAEGMKFQTNTGENAQIVKVVSLKGDQVVIDANHPLAGFTLYFELEILESRPASEDEIAQEMPLQ